MIHLLHLVNFKNFKDATLNLGRLTLLVGANAYGKSNLRDAFRFLHAMGQGYSLAEIIGEKYVEGGLLQWKGIRGGVTETARHGENKFCVESRLGLKSVRFLHRIEVAVSKRGARVSQESLHHNEQPVFSTYPSKGNSEQILVQPDSYPDRTSWLYCDHSKPILSQFLQLLRKQEQRAHLTQAVVHSIDDLKS